MTDYRTNVRAGLYSRVSTEKQASKGHSLPAQRRAAKAWCKDHGLVLGGREWQDAESGTKATRAGYQQMLAAARRGEFGVLVIRDLSRFGRDRWETMGRIGDLLSLGVVIHQVADGRIITPEDDEAYLLTAIGANTNHAEVRAIRRNTRQGQQQAISEGKYLGKTPTGYRKAGVTLQVDRRSAAVITDIYNWYVVDNLGFLAIALRLNAGKVLGKTWAPATIRGILRNPVYRGVTKWGAGEGSVPAIIPTALWLETQRRMEVKAHVGRRAQSSGYLLGGIIRCGDCGGPMSGHSRGPTRPYSYRCRQAVNGLCDHKSEMNGKDLEQLVIDMLRGLTPEFNEMRKAIEQEAARLSASLDVALDERRQIVLRRDNALRSYLRGQAEVISEFAEGELAAQDEAIGRIKTDLERARLLAAGPPPDVTNLKKSLAQMTMPQRKAAIQQLVESVTVYKDRRDVEYVLRA